MRKIIAIIGIVIVLIVVAGVAILNFIDVNQFKPEIAAEVKKTTGRDLVIKGPLKLRVFTLSPSISAEGVTFSNASWGSKKQMLEAQRIAAQIQLIPLLSEEIKVDSVELSGVDLLLETSRNGQGNWDIGTGEKKPQQTETAPAGGFALTTIDRIRLRDVNISYRDGATGETTTFGIKRADANVGKVSNIDMESTLPTGHNLLLKGTVKQGKDSVAISPVSIKADKTDIGGSVNINWGGRRLKVVANLNSEFANLDDFMGGGDDQAQQAEEKKGGRMFTDDPLPVKELRTVDADVTLKSKQLLFSGINLQDGNLKAVLSNGLLTVEDISGKSAEGAFKASAVVNARADTASWRGNVDMRDVEFGKFMTDLTGSKIVEGTKVNADLDVTSVGNSMRALMSNLNGTSVLIGEGGKINNRGLRLISSDMPQLMSWADNSNLNQINCMVNRFEIVNGLATSRVLAFDTNGMRVFGGGTINFGQERINIGIESKAKQASIAQATSIVPISITGNLGSPSVTPNLTGTLANVLKGPGGIVGSLLGGTQQDSTSQEACPVLIQRAQGKSVPQQQQQQAPQQVPSSPSDVFKKLDRNIFGR